MLTTLPDEMVDCNFREKTIQKKYWKRHRLTGNIMAHNVVHEIVTILFYPSVLTTPQTNEDVLLWHKMSLYKAHLNVM